MVKKKKGGYEGFDEKKIYQSVYRACLECSISEEECERIASRIVKKVKAFLKKKGKVLSQEIFELILKELKEIDEDIAYMYETHLDVS